MVKLSVLILCILSMPFFLSRSIAGEPEAKETPLVSLGTVAIDKYEGSVFFQDLGKDGKSYRVTVAIPKPWTAPAIKAERIDVWLLVRGGKTLAVKERPRAGILLEAGSRGATASAIYLFERSGKRSELSAVVVAIDGQPKAFKVVATKGARGTRMNPLIPVVVTVRVRPNSFEEDAPIPLSVSINNGLEGPISFSTFTLESNDWNGETVSLTLMDISRDGEDRELCQSRPVVQAPKRVAGIGVHTIGAGKCLVLRTDARKWSIDGGWKPGKYRMTVRVEKLAIEGERCILSVCSQPLAFEIKSPATKRKTN